MSHLYPVFHLVKLMLAPPDLIEGRQTHLPPPPEIVGGEERYKIEEVIDSRMRHRKLQYLVRWKGYGHKENLWILEGDLDASDLITDFYISGLAKLPSDMLQGAPNKQLVKMDKFNLII
jgi:hypothetical protein